MLHLLDIILKRYVTFFGAKNTCLNAYVLHSSQRSENKGVEPENVAFGSYSGGDFLFVNAERANLIYVYDVGNPKKPKFHQVLPTNVGPEGGLTIPSRNLFVVANEVDARDHKMRSTITIYEYSKKKAKYPTLISKEVVSAD